MPSYTLYRDKLELLRPELGAGPYKVFRSWLRGNYSYAGGELGGKVSNSRGRSRLGSRCGAANCTNIGTLACGGCIAVKYCSKVCQVTDWKAGHKEVCTSKRRVVSPSRSPETSCSGSEIDVDEIELEGDSLWLAFILLSIVFGWLIHVCFILDD
uniref:MYND-type domain-containing protein n=1 Tax=Leptocylindrus danicus TaxID=163516 RepID=A0A6U2Q4E6_9STRA